MKRKHRRLSIVVLALCALGGAVALVLANLEDNLTFFLSPTEIAEKTVEEGRRIRLGGLVVEGSVQRTGDTVNFAVTDHAHTVQIAYTGILPDLFREGQGIVAEGKLVGNQFQAATVLAKHDEQYMPAEVAEALKASGHWEEGADLKAQ